MTNKNQGSKGNMTLRNAIIDELRTNNVNISQLMALVSTRDAQFRGISTPAYRTIVFALEKEGLIKRETTDGITRFTWANKDVMDQLATRFNKAGEPTTKQIAETIETLRDLLFREYGTDYSFAINAKGAVLAASNAADRIIHACTKES